MLGGLKCAYFNIKETTVRIASDEILTVLLIPDEMAKY